MEANDNSNSERLGRIEQALMDVVKSVEDYAATTNRALHGNGKDGLIVQVDRLERSEEDREKREDRIQALLTRTITAVIVMAACGAVGLLWTGLKVALAGSG